MVVVEVVVVIGMVVVVIAVVVLIATFDIVMGHDNFEVILIIYHPPAILVL